MLSGAAADVSVGAAGVTGAAATGAAGAASGLGATGVRGGGVIAAEAPDSVDDVVVVVATFA